MHRQQWFRKFVFNILLGIGGMIFGALFIITGLLIFAVEVLFQGIGKIFIHLT